MTFRGASVSRETLERLKVFTQLVLRWNRTLNLIAHADTPRMWERHVDDSLQLVELIPSATQSALDIGSGAGFPGFILALATEVPFLLVESDKRKAAFLREAARHTGTNVTIIAERVEQVTVRVDMVTARAVAPLPRLLRWAFPILNPNGVCLFSKGQGAAAECQAARTHWQFRLETFASATTLDGIILRISELQMRGGPST